ncbi:hypothetical protein MKW98_026629, partial [Papaver atlanticum]
NLSRGGAGVRRGHGFFLPPKFSPALLIHHLKSMGRKAGGLYINPIKFGTLLKPCMKEMMALLNCLSTSGNNDDKCVKHKDLLRTCTDTQAGVG